jgi:hypothetical protein
MKSWICSIHALLCRAYLFLRGLQKIKKKLRKLEQELELEDEL